MVDTTFITNKHISFYLSINKQFVSVVVGSVGNKKPAEMMQSSATGSVCAERHVHGRLNKSGTHESKTRACSSEAAVSLQSQRAMWSVPSHSLSSNHIGHRRNAQAHGQETERLKITVSIS